MAQNFRFTHKKQFIIQNTYLGHRKIIQFSAFSTVHKRFIRNLCPNDKVVRREIENREDIRFLYNKNVINICSGCGEGPGG